MTQPVAKQGDQVVAVDTHIVGPAMVTLPFLGNLLLNLQSGVRVDGCPVAVVGSQAVNTTGHPGHNLGTIIQGSSGVFVNGQPIARNGDIAMTCNQPADLPVGQVVAAGSVYAGDTSSGDRPPGSSPKGAH